MTIMKMSSKMDAGDIIAQKMLKIGEDEILDILYMRMSILGKELLLDTIPRILDGTASYIQQDESKVTFGFNVTKEDAKIHFERKSIEVKNLVRGLNSVPAAYCFLDNKRMKVYQVKFIKANYSKGKMWRWFY